MSLRNYISKKLRNYISKTVNHALSGSEMLQLNPNTKILTYDELIKIKNIDEILRPHGMCIILYMTSENSGHWTCLFLGPEKNSISFFDSYGFHPDSEQTQYVDLDILINKNETYSYLSKLLIDSRYKYINYNPYRFQKIPNSKTCGAHCTLRLWQRHLTDDEYKKYILLLSKRMKLEIDMAVCYVVYNTQILCL